MPAIVFTADSGTDQLTCVGHGLNTGDGPAATRNIGGALPSPLVAVTDFWVIRIDADHVKLATSSANAMAGIAINLTTNGTGTNILEIGIPYRRPRTYAQFSQVKSEDLNGFSDALKALYALLTAQAQSIWSGIQIAGSLLVGADLNVAGTVTSDLVMAPGKKLKDGVITTIVPLLAPSDPGPAAGRSAVIHDTGSGASTRHVDLPLDVGRTISAIRLRLLDSSTGPATARFRLLSSTGGGSYTALLATSNTSSGAGTEQTVQITGQSILTAPGTVYTVVAECVTGTANVLLYRLEVDHAQL